MPKLRRILVPFDYSASAEAALLFAVEIARTSDARLLVHHFVEIEIHMLGDYPVIKGDPLAHETERLQAHVRRVLAAAGESSPPCEIDATWGFPVLRIVETVIDREVDLIVMGTHVPSGRAPLGSVAAETVRLAPCPVLTVRGLRTVPDATRATVAPEAVGAECSPSRVASVMTPNPVTIAPDDSLADARARMSAARIRHLPVVDVGRLVGILSDADFPAYAGRFARTRVLAAMTADPFTVAADDAIETAARLMLERRVRALPVVESGKVIGMLSAIDILEDYVRVASTRAVDPR